jgi:hypothetical protein
MAAVEPPRNDGADSLGICRSEDAAETLDERRDTGLGERLVVLTAQVDGDGHAGEVPRQ